MPKHLFPKGNKFGKGGKKPGAGRKSNKQKELEAWTERKLRDYLYKHGQKIIERYIKLAASARSAPTTRHAMDKLLPPVEKVQHTGNVNYLTNLPKPKK